MTFFRVTRLVEYDGIVTGFTGEETTMSLGSHLQELRKKHQLLSEAVEEAQRHPAYDDLAISDMKKEKLRIKEEIARLSQA